MASPGEDSGGARKTISILRSDCFMRRLIQIIIFISLAVVLLLTAWRSCKPSIVVDEANPADTIEILVSRISECSRLYTAEVSVHKLITHDDRFKLKGSLFSQPLDMEIPLSKRKIAIPVDATLKAYIDFSTFSAANVHADGARIEIFLPEPKIILAQSKVRNEDIKKYVPLLRSDFSDEELTSYSRQGRQQIIESIPRLGLIPQAREGAANVLVPLLEQLGYRAEDITITFRKDFNEGDILRMIEQG